MFKVIYFFIVTVLGWNMTQTCSWQVSSHFVTPGWLMLLELLSVWFNELLYLYSELFYKDKTVLSPRDTLRFPQLAETMETISKEGADAFYTGKIARHLIQDVQERSMNCLYINGRRCNQNRCSAFETVFWHVCLFTLFTFVFFQMESYH